MISRKLEPDKWMFKLIRWVFRLFMFGVYIRTLASIFFPSLLSSALEVYSGNDRSSIDLQLSYAISLCILTIWTAFTATTICMWALNFKESKFNELFSGNKRDRISRLYIIILLLKRVVFVLLVTILSSFYFHSKIAIMTVIQVFA